VHAFWVSHRGSVALNLRREATTQKDGFGEGVIMALCCWWAGWLHMCVSSICAEYTGVLTVRKYNDEYASTARMHTFGR